MWSTTKIENLQTETKVRHLNIEGRETIVESIKKILHILELEVKDDMERTPAISEEVTALGVYLDDINVNTGFEKIERAKEIIEAAELPDLNLMLEKLLGIAELKSFLVDCLDNHCNDSEVKNFLLQFDK